MKKIARMLFGKRTEKEKKKKTHPIIRPRPHPVMGCRSLVLLKGRRTQGPDRPPRIRRQMQRKATVAGLPATTRMPKRSSARFAITSRETYARLAGKGTCGNCLLKSPSVLPATLPLRLQSMRRIGRAVTPAARSSKPSCPKRPGRRSTTPAPKSASS